MNFSFLLAFCCLLATGLAIIVVDDNGAETDDFSSEEDLSRRRHRLCATNRVAPPPDNDKSLVNLYYNDVDILGDTNNYLGGSSSGCLGGGIRPQRPHRPHRPIRPSQSDDSYYQDGSQRPGFFQVLFPVLETLFAPRPQSSPQASTGPLGGSVPDRIRNDRDRFNSRKFYRQVNRDIDRWLRPLYRLF